MLDEIQLKRVSLTLSVVGRKPSAAINERRLLRHCPPIIRRALFFVFLLLLLGFFDERELDFRVDMIFLGVLMSL